jgi:hypothetical protein
MKNLENAPTGQVQWWIDLLERIPLLRNVSTLRADQRDGCEGAKK